MDVDNFIAPGGEFADAVQQVWRGAGELVEPGADALAEVGPALGVAVVVEQLLAARAQDLLDRVGPRRVCAQGAPGSQSRWLSSAAAVARTSSCWWIGQLSQASARVRSGSVRRSFLRQRLRLSTPILEWAR